MGKTMSKTRQLSCGQVAALLLSIILLFLLTPGIALGLTEPSALAPEPVIATLEAQDAETITTLAAPITGEGYTFDADSGLLTITTNAGTTAWRTNTSIYPGTGVFNERARAEKIQSLVIQEGVTAIGARAFYECHYLLSVDLPAGLETIGADAFGNCWQLSAVSLPASVTSIGLYAFEHCNCLTSIDLSVCTQLTTIAIGMFSGGHLSSVTLPAGIEAIGDHAFSQCNLTSVDLSGYSNLTTIGTGAYYRNLNLISISLPASLETIDERAFNYCESLPSVDLSGCTGLTAIGELSFAHCLSLTTISFPASLETIGANAFVGSTGLNTLYFAGSTVPTLYGGEDPENGSFVDIPTTGTLHYPAGGSTYTADYFNAATNGGNQFSAWDFVTPPALSAGAESVTRNSDNDATVEFGSDKNGEYYYVVTEPGQAPPVFDTANPGTAFTAPGGTITLDPSTPGFGAGAKDIHIIVKGPDGSISDILTITIPAYTHNGGTGNENGSNDGSESGVSAGAGTGSGSGNGSDTGNGGTGTGNGSGGGNGSASGSGNENEDNSNAYSVSDHFGTLVGSDSAATTSEADRSTLIRLSNGSTSDTDEGTGFTVAAASASGLENANSLADNGSFEALVGTGVSILLLVVALALLAVGVIMFVLAAMRRRKEQAAQKQATS